MVLAKVLFDDGNAVTIGAKTINQAMTDIGSTYYPYVRQLYIADDDEERKEVVRDG